MSYSENAMCAILLCSNLGINKGNSLKPLSLKEWNIFLEKMIEIKENPSVVFSNESNWMEKMNYSEEEKERMVQLLARGVNVAFELDSLKNKGIQVITMFDSDYPVLLKRKLKTKTPPVLFYAGNLELAKKVGIAVVGSRNVDDEGMRFAEELVKKASKEKLIIYSGGARGVDTISETTALNSGGAVVSFVADSLLTKIKKKEVISAILSGRLLLISDVKPDVGFSVGRAMNRNKYIYTSAYGAFIIASDYNKGGTWNGAIESIKNNYTKTLIWNYAKYNGNLKLIENGGIPYEITEETIYSVITKKQQDFVQLDLFKDDFCLQDEKEMEETRNNLKDCDTQDVYDMIKTSLIEYIGNGRSFIEISEYFNIIECQLDIWLERLCQDNWITLENKLYKKK